MAETQGSRSPETVDGSAQNTSTGDSTSQTSPPATEPSFFPIISQKIAGFDDGQLRDLIYRICYEPCTDQDSYQIGILAFADTLDKPRASRTINITSPKFYIKLKRLSVPQLRDLAMRLLHVAPFAGSNGKSEAVMIIKEIKRGSGSSRSVPSVISNIFSSSSERSPSLPSTSPSLSSTSPSDADGGPGPTPEVPKTFYNLREHPRTQPLTAIPENGSSTEVASSPPGWRRHDPSYFKNAVPNPVAEYNAHNAINYQRGRFPGPAYFHNPPGSEDTASDGGTASDQPGATSSDQAGAPPSGQSGATSSHGNTTSGQMGATSSARPGAPSSARPRCPDPGPPRRPAPPRPGATSSARPRGPAPHQRSRPIHPTHSARPSEPAEPATPTRAQRADDGEGHTAHVLDTEYCKVCHCWYSIKFNNTFACNYHPGEVLFGHADWKTNIPIHIPKDLRLQQIRQLDATNAHHRGAFTWSCCGQVVGDRSGCNRDRHFRLVKTEL